MNRSGRAAPLSAPERRAAIIAATIPLLREHGVAVTTRRIAEAAQVAEGTIFSVFPDKETLIAAALDAALAPDATVERLRGIDATLPLDDRLGRAVETLQSHFAGIWRLMAAVGPNTAARRKPERNEVFVQFGPALEALLRPSSAELGLPPKEAARALLAVTMGCTFPLVVDEPLPHARVVSMFLDGVRKSRGRRGR